MQIFGTSDTGVVRKVNQDSFFTRVMSKSVTVGVVCDGMGGTNGGCEASAIAIREFATSLCDAITILSAVDGVLEITDAKMRRTMVQGVNKANTAVYEKSKTFAELEGMGTTLVAFVLSGDKLYCINVGDSRLYTVSQESVCQITKDHSYVQYLVDTGAITPEEALTHPRKNIITRAVGTHEDVDPDFFVLEGDQIGTYVLICSDGLTNFVSDEEIQRVLMNTADIEQACNTLVGMANANGGGDNITVVILSTK